VTAYTLAGELARHCIPLKGSAGGEQKRATRKDLEHALAEYERKCRVLTDPAQKGMPEWAKSIFMPETETSLRIVDGLIKLLFPVGRWLASWLPEDKPEALEKQYAWHDYPELEGKQ